MDKSLEGLLTLAQTLNVESDALNAVIDDVESRLEQGKVGVEWWLTAELANRPCLLATSAKQGKGMEVLVQGWQLGYAKVANAWRLVVKRVEERRGFADGDPEQPYYEVVDMTEPVPLSNAPRQVRIEAAGQMERLVQQLGQQVERHIAAIANAKRLALR